MITSCPICGLKHNPIDDAKGFYTIKCTNCGDFEITPSVLSFPIFKDKKYILAGYLFNRDNKEKEITIDSSNFEKLINSITPPISPFEKIDSLLIYIFKNTKFSGEEVIIELERYPLCYSYNTDEFDYLLKKAKELQYIENRISYFYYLSLKGWDRINQIYNSNIDSNQAFVAMWFEQNMEEIYSKAIYPALNDTGYVPIKINDVHHNDKIDNRIMAEIRKSGLVIADFTGNRGGVYFEAGFALGLNIPVIWTCKDTEIKELHFDTRQYNHIAWKDDIDFKKQLIDRIEGTGLSRKINR